jgi:hypothetical protein
MKLKITIEVDVSKTIAETMQRNGFSACPDGSAMQIKIPNAPAIPKRKTKVVFTTSQEDKQCVDKEATCCDQKKCCKQGKG